VNNSLKTVLFKCGITDSSRAIITWLVMILFGRTRLQNKTNVLLGWFIYTKLTGPITKCHGTTTHPINTHSNIKHCASLHINIYL